MSESLSLGVKVTAIEAVQFSVPLKDPVRYGKIERRRSASTLIRVRAANDMVGYGEACCVPQLTAESAESVVSLVNLYLKNLIPGTDVLNWRRTMAEIRRRFPKSYTGLAAVETALLDLAGKTLNVSASYLIGSRYRDKVELCASISWDKSADKMAKDAKKKSAEYNVLKVYVGPDDLKSDLHRLETVRAAVDDKIKIMLDVKGLWSSHTAISVASAMKGAGVFLVEQPVNPEDFDGAARVTRVYQDQYGILTAADEAIETPEDAYRISKAQAYSSLNIGLTKMGGPDIALRAAEVAHAAHMPVFVGSFAELGIATAAGIHLAVSLPELAGQAYLSGPERFTETITTPVLLPKGGYAYLPEGPGLGVEVDEDKIKALATEV